MGSGQCTAVIGEETAAAGRDQRHLRQAGGPAGGETGGAGGAGAGAGQRKLDRLESQQAGLQTDLACPLARCGTGPIEVDFWTGLSVERKFLWKWIEPLLY